MAELKLKPCAFCGDDEKQSHKFCTVTYKKSRKKVLRIYHELCSIKCGGCTCTITQAGATREGAYINACKAWNRRTDGEEDNNA